MRFADQDYLRPRVDTLLDAQTIRDLVAEGRLPIVTYIDLPTGVGPSLKKARIQVPPGGVGMDTNCEQSKDGVFKFDVDGDGVCEAVGEVWFLPEQLGSRMVELIGKAVQELRLDTAEGQRHPVI